MRRPSVLFLNRVYPPSSGATGRVLRDLARSFAREGWQVTVITTGPKAVKDRDGGIRVIHVKAPEKPGGLLSYSWVWMKILIKALRQPPTHLLVTMSDPPLLVLAGEIISKFKKNRHIHWCHDLYPDILPALNVRLPKFVLGYFKKLTRRAMERADKVIVIGRCMAKHLTVSGVDARHITVIPNWPDPELLHPPSEQPVNGSANGIVDGEVMPSQTLTGGPKFRVLYAGNIGRAHPLDTILDAAEILHESHPEIEFVFVGDGKRFDEIATQRSKRSLDNIRLLPYQPVSRLRQVMESGDVHIISVKDEAAGMLVPSKLYSALAVARPCIFIGPAQSETAKVITDFKAGDVVAQGHARELADKIVQYRVSSEVWFAAHGGASEASKVFLPKESINAWMERAWGVVRSDLEAA